jgi:hypothetical protein
MSALTNICREAFTQCEVYRQGISTDKAVEVALPRVMADPEALRHAARIGVDKTVTDMATRQRRKERDKGEGDQFEMFEEFGLRQRYAIDTDGRKLKYTGWLTLMDFMRIIQMRRDQLLADQNHLGALEKTLERLRPIWEAKPHLMFDEVALLYRDAA